MAVDVLDIKNSLKNLLTENNTNTSDYDVSESLQRRVKKISSASSKQTPVLKIDYPVIFVELKRTSDAHTELGNTARRDTTIEIDLVPVIDYGMGTTEGNENSNDECIQLTQNIMYLLRNNITLSNTVDHCLIDSVEYAIDEGTYNSQARISLTIKKRG